MPRLQEDLASLVAIPSVSAPVDPEETRPALLEVAPQTVLAAYRVGDSPANVVTPLMAYFPLIVVFVQRYRKDAGIGSVVALMLPYVAVLTIAWTLFFVAWYLIGIPLGPGAPVHTD